MALSQTVKKPRRDRRFCANLCEAFRLWCGRQDSNLHAEAEEPKSTESTNSTTPANKLCL